MNNPIECLVMCKFCGREPKHRMYKEIYHQYVCHCLHRSYTDETTVSGARAQWNKQNSQYLWLERAE